MIVDSLLYGNVVVQYATSEITATYDGEPRTTVSVRRTGGADHTRTPIGTRDPSAITASIDGRPVELTPGKARIMKRSYDVGISFDGRLITMRAKNLEASTLLCGTTDDGMNSFGELTRVYDGTVDIEWSVPFAAMKKTIEPPIPSREEALVGIAVAAAFGTGGLSAATIVSSIVGSVFPS
ncbi:hypothetical protein GCM10007304_38920 [Rhodococcoides trifolii]|uniref:Uncharacterized protein n=1 Tax=Rhodococcoides trifolii TaxID=908250 RepID=A0A917G3Z5_9NOCA|nr:hypothetical protein [Rhodococcus trifolii]GGG21284.1 hypothetical protein GCM10007304_38920 [Rhodococcus trifolii]